MEEKRKNAIKKNSSIYQVENNLQVEEVITLQMMVIN